MLAYGAAKVCEMAVVAAEREEASVVRLWPAVIRAMEDHPDDLTITWAGLRALFTFGVWLEHVVETHGEGVIVAGHSVASMRALLATRGVECVLSYLRRFMGVESHVEFVEHACEVLTRLVEEVEGSVAFRLAMGHVRAKRVCDTIVAVLGAFPGWEIVQGNGLAILSSVHSVWHDAVTVIDDHPLPVGLTNARGGRGGTHATRSQGLFYHIGRAMHMHRWSVLIQFRACLLVHNLVMVGWDNVKGSRAGMVQAAIASDFPFDASMAMRMFPNNRHIQRWAVKACLVLMVVGDSAAVATELVDVDLPKLIVTAMKRFGKKYVQAGWCKALAHLARGGWRKLLEAGALEAVLEAMDMHHAFPNVQGEGCRALHALAKTTGVCRSAIVRAGGLRRVFAALITHRTVSPHLAKLAKALIFTLASDSARGRNTGPFPTAITGAFIASAMETMRKRKDMPSEQETGCALLVVFGRRKKTRDLAVDAGGFSRLADVMQNPKVSVATQKLACMALRALCV